MRRSTVDVNHPHLSHPVRGWGRSLGTQRRQLTVSGLLSVQRRVIHGVCGAGPTVRACGADGGTVKPPHAVFRTIKPSVGVWSMGTGHTHSSLLEQVRVCVQPLISPRQTVGLSTHVLVWFNIPSLQDGAGTRRDGPYRSAGIRQSVPRDSGAARYGALPWAERYSGG